MPGYFAGWKLEPGLWKGVVKIFDQEAIRLGKPNAFFPIKIRQAEVIFPKVADITFPLYNARQKAVATGKDFWEEVKEIESPPTADTAIDDGSIAPAQPGDDTTTEGGLRPARVQT